MIARIIVKISRLRVRGFNLIPYGVYFRINPIIGTNAMLVPILNPTRSILSISRPGYRIFIRQYPGRNSTVIMPRKYLT